MLKGEMFPDMFEYEIFGKHSSQRKSEADIVRKIYATSNEDI